jgi:hypothetical protein
MVKAAARFRGSGQFECLSSRRHPRFKFPPSPCLLTQTSTLIEFFGDASSFQKNIIRAFKTYDTLIKFFQTWDRVALSI